MTNRQLRDQLIEAAKERPGGTAAELARVVPGVSGSPDTDGAESRHAQV